MTIKELKSQIEDKTLGSEGLIFYYKKDRFLADQYVKEISRIKNRPIVYLNSIPSTSSIWGDIDDGNLSVIICDNIEESIPNNCIVLTKTKCDNCIEFPELEQWQIKDYAESICKGSDDNTLQKLIKANKDMYGLQNELDKLVIFDDIIRKTLCVEFVSNNVFHNLSSVETFDFSNAVQNKNSTQVGQMYNSIEREPMSFVGLMCKQFRNMVNVYLQNNPNEQNTGLKDKQIWAIKNVCKNYTKQEVFDKFKFLLSIDYRLKCGELPADMIFDYVLVKLFSM